MSAANIKERSLFDAAIVLPALWQSLQKLTPRHLAKNPVMFVVAVGSLLCVGLWVRDLVGARSRIGSALVFWRGLSVAVVHRPVCQLRRSRG